MTAVPAEAGTAAWDWTDETRGRLERLLAGRGLCEGPVTTRRIGDGHSNLTFLVEDAAGRRVVVRRGPPGPTAPGGNDMLREARLIGALAATGLPVPRLLATADAGEVVEVPCYVMSHVEGPVVTSATPAALSTRENRWQAGVSLVDTLADLHAVDWRAAGLAGLGRPDGFNARQLRTFARLAAGDGPLPTPFAAVHGWLGEQVPAESRAAVVHGDYRIGNVVLAPDPPGRVAAVLDWELAALGDPLHDVGYFLASVPVAGEPWTPTQLLGTALLEDGFPSRAQLATRYARRAGVDLGGEGLGRLRWYTVFAQFKLAALYEYSWRRAATGTGDPYYADHALVWSFLAAAHRAAGLSLFVAPIEEAAP